MSEPFLGEIKIVPYNFAPRSWADCDGQLLPISQNSALFSLVGTIYGGDGRTTFGLPDMRGRFVTHTGQGPGLSNYTIGQKGGAETSTLTTNNLAAHSHSGTVTTALTEGDRSDPSGAFLARPEEPLQPYAGAAGGTLAANSVQTYNTGGGQPFGNIPPYLTMRFIIALVGIYPSRN